MYILRGKAIELQRSQDRIQTGEMMKKSMERAAIYSLIFWFGCGFSGGFLYAQTRLARVSVETKTLGTRVPEDFVGISLEVSTAGQGIGAFAPDATTARSKAALAEYALGKPDAPNKVFFRFMRNLGPGILRLGGNSQDNTCWKPKSAPHPDWCKGPIGLGDLHLFSDAAKESGWRLIIGMNLKQNSPAWALDEVKEGIAKEIPPQQIIGLELGNEPDLFARDGSRKEAYSAQDHVEDFLAYFKAFRHDEVGQKFALIGPATCCSWHNPADLGLFLDGVRSVNLKLATVHSYMLTTCGGRRVSIQELLGPELMEKFDAQAKSLVAAARQRNLPIALAETNSASCGGMPGVSNAFASTLWGLDSLFSGAQDGYSGMNFHISYRSDGSSYNPVDTYRDNDGPDANSYENDVEPLYYAMYFFAKNVSGKYLLRTETKTESNVRSYATTECADCTVNVAVLNKDVSGSGQVQVRVANRAGTAKLLLLRAPKLESLAADVSYGGAQFDHNADISTPKTREVRSDAQGNFEFELPNAAIALLVVPGEKGQ
jgi:hypothetical protein